MTGVRAPHLQRRNGIYHLRLRVPDAVRPLVGRSEVRRSFGTYSYRKARSLAARYAAKVMEAFDVIATGQLTRERAQELVRNCFADLVAETEAYGGFIPETNFPDMEVLEQLGLSQERVHELKGQVATCDFDGEVTSLGRNTATRQGIDLETSTLSGRLNVLSGIARALIEQQRLFQFRLTDRLSTFSPADPLFATLAKPTTWTPSPDFEDSSKGPTVGKAISDYLGAHQREWVQKTCQARVWQLRFFEEHVGQDRPLSCVTAEHVRTFRDAVRTLHKFHGQMRTSSFAQRQTDNPNHRISGKTAVTIFEPVKAFMRWAASTDGIILINPAQNIRAITPKKQKGEKSRRPFAAEELRILFSAPTFTGCQSVHRRYEPGDQIIKDAKYWLPILGYYTGARLGELVQLHVKDIHLDGSIPHLSINEKNGPEVATGDRKHVKSHAAVRLVPLHPDVLELGFANLVARRKRRKGKGSVRMFSEFPYGSDGQASTVASKWFARLMDSVGLTDRKLVYHSFRHAAEDALRDAKEPQYVVDRIIGHSDGATSSGYGDGVSLEVAYEAVKTMKLKLRLPEVLGDAA